MDEPEFRTSRIAIALGLLAALAVGGGGFLLGRAAAPTPVPATAPAVPPAPDAPVIASESPLLGRADFLALAARAADAYAANAPLTKDVSNAVGRRFDLLLPFGCEPASPNKPGATSWSYDEKRGRLNITIPPVTWSAADWRLAEAPPIDAIEGFWISRPWSSSSACPPPILDPAGVPTPVATDPATATGSAQKTAADKHAPPAEETGITAAPPPKAEETLAVAQFFTADGNTRIRRAGRPYSIVTRVTPDQFDASQGFRLRLTGRIDRTPGGEPVRCHQPKGRDTPPICVVATVLDEVRVENPATGTVLATWSAGHSSR